MFFQPAFFVPSLPKLMGSDKKEKNNTAAFLRLRVKAISVWLLGWVTAIFQAAQPGQGWKPHRTYFPNTCLIKDLSI